MNYKLTLSCNHSTETDESSEVIRRPAPSQGIWCNECKTCGTIVGREPIKIPAVKIELERAEGRIEECGSITCLAGEFRSPWENANARLQSWARTAPSDGSYNKCDFKIIFADGETYEGRFDLQAQHQFEPYLLGTHVKQFLSFIGGLWNSWANKEQYAQVLKEHGDEDVQGAIKFLNQYDIPSNWKPSLSF